jgi:eukaryotic-like serine/threonine-protein kinase
MEAATTPTVPEHELLRLIGSGSGGQVWLARNALGTYRAVKIVQESMFRHRRPFEREFHGIQKFEPVSRLHDGLVDILQVGLNEAAGYFYYVMELADDVVTGPNIHPESYVPRTLEQDRLRLKRFPVAECVRLGAAIASALGFLHKHGLFHRDIKPSNIIFVSGTPKLADIGLVTDAFEGRSFVGTEGFLAPEGSGTVRSDVYALGKVLYEISTGRDRNDYPALPEFPPSRAEVADLILLNKIILKACRAKPWYRYQTAEEMMLALLSFQFNKPTLYKKQRNSLLTKVFGVLACLLGLGILGGLIWRFIWLMKHP